MYNKRATAPTASRPRTRRTRRTRKGWQPPMDPVHHMDQDGEPTNLFGPSIVDETRQAELRAFIKEREEMEELAQQAAAAAAASADASAGFDGMDFDDDFVSTPVGPSSPQLSASDEAASDNDNVGDRPTEDGLDDFEDDFEMQSDIREILGLPPLGPNPETSSYAEKRRSFFGRFRSAKPHLVQGLACYLTSDLLGRTCSRTSCDTPATFKCHTCMATSTTAHIFFCQDHAILHQWNNTCHRLGNNLDKPPPARITEGSVVRNKKIQCCQKAKGGGHLMHLHSLTGIEQVMLVQCDEHYDCTEVVKVLIRDFGFFPSRLQNPTRAFSIQMLALGLKFQSAGVSYQCSAEVFMGDDFKNVRWLNVYEPYMDAVRQYATVMHSVHHGLFTNDIERELGLVMQQFNQEWCLGMDVCPACIGGSSPKGPLAHTMDGFESANKKSVEQGGGGNHGVFEFARAWFKQTVVTDYVRDSSKSKAGKLGCEAQHKAGTEGGSSNGKDVDRIIHVDCAAHGVVHRIYDAKGGERLIYADDVMNWLMTFGRVVIFGYDIACKLLSHWHHYGLWTTLSTAALIILFIPGMHVYAHGKDCQCLFGPRVIMGLGLSMDGEGHEQVNATLSRSIGLTQRETTENREMDIVLVVSHHNQGKIRTFAAWTAGKLALASAGLKGLLALTPVVDELKLEESSYKNVVVRTTDLRQRLLSTSGTGVASTRESLREKIDAIARTILAVERHLKSAPGTKMAARLKSALSSSFVAFYRLAAEYNDLDPSKPSLNFATVKKELVTTSETMDSNNVKLMVTLYWRHCEDVYHHLNYLQNTIDYFDNRARTYWRKVRGLLDIDGAVGSVILERDRLALLHIVRRRVLVESTYANAARDIFEDSVGIMNREHLKQIGDMFSAHVSCLGGQNMRT
ncbi:hypothetical protein BDR26DRAFT_918544 [Obelidium mucronatum]|nr:hypothetical protein BDR26DRAFT_918544 [Obelidium mucronatum]